MLLFGEVATSMEETNAFQWAGFESAMLTKENYYDYYAHFVNIEAEERVGKVSSSTDNANCCLYALFQASGL